MMSEVLAKADVGLAEQISAHFLPRLLHLQRRGWLWPGKKRCRQSRFHVKFLQAHPKLAHRPSLVALPALWTSSVMSLLVVIDACVFGAATHEARCARLARRPTFSVDSIWYVS